MSGLRRVNEGDLRGEAALQLLPRRGLRGPTTVDLSVLSEADAWTACSVRLYCEHMTRRMLAPVRLIAPTDRYARELLEGLVGELPDLAAFDPERARPTTPAARPDEVVVPASRFRSVGGSRALADLLPTILADVCEANEALFLAAAFDMLAENACEYGGDIVVGAVAAASYDPNEGSVQMVVADLGSSFEDGDEDADEMLAVCWDGPPGKRVPGGLRSVALMAEAYGLDVALTLRAGEGRLSWRTDCALVVEGAEEAPGFTAAVTLHSS